MCLSTWCSFLVILAVAISSRTAEISRGNAGAAYDDTNGSQGESVEYMSGEDDDHSSQVSDSDELHWRHHWSDLEEHKQNLTLVYTDDNLAVYFDPQVNKSITWPFQPLSQAWNYVKETYGSFGPDPRLYIVLHGNTESHPNNSNNNNSNNLNNSNASKYAYESGCLISTFWMKLYEFRNVIDCETKDLDNWANNNNNKSSHHLETLLNSMGQIVRSGAKGVENIADASYCSSGMVKILTYDIYSHLQNQSDNNNQEPVQLYNVASWKRRQLNENINNKTGGCFKNWILPIYEKYGGASVLNNFFNYTFMYWPQAPGGGYNEYMNVGEWIHFWSGAAGVDLEPFGNTTIGWKDWVQDELEQARKNYPYFSYTDKEPSESSSSRGGGPLKLIVIAILIFIFVCVFLGGGVLAIHRKMN